MRTLLVLGVLLVAQAASAEDKVFRASLVAAVVAHSADLAETQHCVGAGRCRELNPWLARFESPSGFAIAKMTVASLSLWGTAKLRESHPKWAIVANVAQTVAFSWIAVRNARVGR